MYVQIESGASDCGLFSIAFAACLCQGPMQILMDTRTNAQTSKSSLSFAPAACLKTKWVWSSALGVKNGFIRSVKISLELFFKKSIATWFCI